MGYPCPGWKSPSRRVQTSGDSRSSSHSILTLREHGHLVQPLPQGGSAPALLANWVISQGGNLESSWEQLLGRSQQISHQWKRAAGIAPNCKQKHRKLGTIIATGAARPPGAKLMDLLKLSQPAQEITTGTATLTAGKLHEN